MAGSSPSMAIKREDFPLPTDPVTAIICPFFKEKETSFKAILSSCLSQEAETFRRIRSLVLVPRIPPSFDKEINFAFSTLMFSCLTVDAISFRLRLRKPHGPRLEANVIRLSLYVGVDKNFSIRLIAVYASAIKGNKYPIAIETEKLITFKVERMVNMLKAVICSPAAISVTTEMNPARGAIV